MCWLTLFSQSCTNSSFGQLYLFAYKKLFQLIKLTQYKWLQPLVSYVGHVEEFTEPFWSSSSLLVYWHKGDNNYDYLSRVLVRIKWDNIVHNLLQKTKITYQIVVIRYTIV